MRYFFFLFFSIFLTSFLLIIYSSSFLFYREIHIPRIKASFVNMLKPVCLSYKRCCRSEVEDLQFVIWDANRVISVKWYVYEVDPSKEFSLSPTNQVLVSISEYTSSELREFREVAWSKINYPVGIHKANIRECLLPIVRKYFKEKNNFFYLQKEAYEYRVPNAYSPSYTEGFFFITDENQLCIFLERGFDYILSKSVHSAPSD